MAVTGVVINNIIARDHYSIRRTVTHIPTTQTLSKAWFTVKDNLDDADVDAIVQKAITSSLVAGQGQITNIGTNGQGGLVFTLTPTDTLAIQTATGALLFDIQILTSAGLIYTLELGTISAIADVTISNS